MDRHGQGQDGLSRLPDQRRGAESGRRGALRPARSVFRLHRIFLRHAGALADRERSHDGPERHRAARRHGRRDLRPVLRRRQDPGCDRGAGDPRQGRLRRRRDADLFHHRAQRPQHPAGRRSSARRFRQGAERGVAQKLTGSTVQFSKLRLSGFKTFVDPTELSIEPGMTGVVGPNGCGKSNLVEALRWAMGETSAKRMRGGEMDDVIFAGTQSRPARNIAEVTLLLDNTTRRAPGPFAENDELEVTRRIERGSGSGYRVNAREVRARDVQLLFADAASGAHSAAMVGQGRVAAVINAKPAERRAILAEAAGIAGLHARRHEAELRLKAAEANLARLDDVIVTMAAQLDALRKQAKQAQRYRRVAEQIRRFEAIALHRRWQASSEALDAAQAKLDAAERGVADRTQTALAGERERENVAEALPGLRHAEAAAGAELHRLTLAMRALDEEERRVAAARQSAQERLTQLGSDRVREEELAADAAAATDKLGAERDELAAAQAREADAPAEAAAALADISREVAALETELTRLTRVLAEQEARRAALTRQIAEATSRRDRLSAAQADNERQREALDAEAASVPPRAD